MWFGNPSWDNPDNKYGLFDDIKDGLTYWYQWKSFLGCQRDFVITDKYKKKHMIHWGKPCIYLSNYNPLDDLSSTDRRWLLDNAFVVHLTKPLYDQFAEPEVTEKDGLFVSESEDTDAYIERLTKEDTWESD